MHLAEAVGPSPALAAFPCLSKDNLVGPGEYLAGFRCFPHAVLYKKRRAGMWRSAFVSQDVKVGKMAAYYPGEVILRGCCPEVSWNLFP